MIDIFGNELSIGDTVAFTPPKYQILLSGTIVNISEKMVRIKYLNTTSHDYNTKGKFRMISIYPYNTAKDMRNV